jgi:radical SAM protein with 4Fe4S-binding SPASM domain
MNKPFYITPKSHSKDEVHISEEKFKNNLFCVAPWIHLHVINNGDVYACCQTELLQKNSFGNVNNKKLIDIINSNKAKNMRKNMLNGKGLPKSCYRCISKEKVELNSMRIGLNDTWLEETRPLINKTKEDGTISDLQLKYWDFRFSNYCNLACTTCGPLFSTQWASDWEKLNPESGKFNETRLINLEKIFIY